MFSRLNGKWPASKAYVFHGTLPQYIDLEKPPSKKTPFSTILSQNFTHTVQLILPQELYHVIWEDIETKISNIRYSRVIMSLSEILEGDFFNKYIKIGNILMLSEGRPGIDDRYTLTDGILRLELAKDKYERCGLVGQPIRDAGRKHIKTRFAVEINLRSPSMLHGKKGFERIVWAFKNVLNHSVAWLFHDFTPSSEHENDAPITKHHPVTKECQAQTTTAKRVRLPDLSPLQCLEFDDGFEDWALETYEWLNLVSIESPRICFEDTIDPFLSRYQVPDSESGKVSDMAILTWTGLIPNFWIRKLFILLSSAKTSNRTWRDQPFFALSAYSFKTAVTDQKDAYTLLCQLDGIVNDHIAGVTASRTREPRDLKAGERHGKEYALWQLSCG